MQIHGACHCGAIAFDLDWPDGAPILPRACGCTFCRKHGAAWTAHPDARLTVRMTREEGVSAYRFGTRTAVFHVCVRCGAVPVCTSEIGGRRYAVVNVRAFEGLQDPLPEPSAFDVDGEAEDARLARRVRRWIGTVTMVADRRALPVLGDP
ncbi:hypothetical protein P3W24_04840 [Luteibacter sp. PPL201]|jgi:hypothetical protein|uniref:CENP-V/GFA domain-containing protein n=1 Tax=Luteibacter sahnii TaxID=3021977 RepID=A0ABT6B8A8_9GAMM|nr:hypothetical protein [Luteibacter sp. PPL193]MDY1547804.1 hypothetical protein [Luteibacter sp. PPL193]